MAFCRPLAQCVDRFVPDHKGLLEVGHLVTAKVTEVDSEKQRFLVTLKESEIENESDLPDWAQLGHIFESYQREVNSFCDYSGIPFHFGDTVRVSTIFLDPNFRDEHIFKIPEIACTLRIQVDLDLSF